MNKLWKWVVSLFTGKSQSSSVFCVGKGNSVNITQNVKHSITPLTQEELKAITQKAVADAARRKIVTGSIKTSPGPNAQPLNADKLRKAVNASRSRSSTSSRSTSNVSDDYTTIAVVTSLHSSNDGGSYHSGGGGCDAGSSPSCD